MKSFFEWMADFHGEAPQNALLLGKGPSFVLRDTFCLDEFDLTVGLNHVVRELPVDIAHVIDLEVVEHCGEAIARNAGVLVMPWVPHVRKVVPYTGNTLGFKPGPDNLDACCDGFPVLARLRGEGRLLYYNLATADVERAHPGAPIVPGASFSAVVMLQLLASAGIRRVRTLGIDGGRGYSNQFQDLNATTHLAAGQATYNAQFDEIAKIIMNEAIDFAPLGADEPITVFVGTQPEQMLAFKVLEYSIRKYSSMNVQVRALHETVNAAHIAIPEPVDPKNRPRTPFSFQRFIIPELMQYRGRAIYLDSDMQVFRDMRELWDWPFKGAQILAVRGPEDTGRIPQFSVMVLDCENLRWQIEELVAGLDSRKWSYEQLVYEMAAAGRVSAELPESWNELERYTASGTALLHYTDMDSQPWLTTENILGYVWCRDLFDAVSAGFISRAMIDDHIANGWVRPSLAHQLDHDIVDPLLLPWRIKRQDIFSFVPPHVKDGYGRPLPWGGRVLRRMYASSRFFWNNTGLPKLYRRASNKTRQLMGWAKRQFS
jgi:hypothetical protein